MDEQEPVEAKDLTQRLNEAISSVMGEDGVLVSKWLLIADLLTDEGRQMAYLAADGTMTWEILGMSEAAAELARTTMSEGYIDAMMDDEDVEIDGEED